MSGQFLRFAVVGTIGFLVDTAVLLALTKGLGLSPFLARAISFAVALTTTWIINRSWTFAGAKTPKSWGQVGSEFLSYVAVQLIGGAVNLATYAVVVALMGDGSGVLVAATAAGSIAGMLVNYFGNKSLVFGGNAAVERLQRWTGRTALLAVGAGIFLIPALFNHGPFIAFDSEQYYTIGRSIAGALGDLAGHADPAPATSAAVSAAVSVPATDPGQGGAWASSFAGARSPFFSTFLYVGVQAVGLWGVVFLQALIGAWLVSLLIAEFTGGFKARAFLVTVSVLAVFSSIGYFAAWAMADVFAGYTLLAGVLFLVGRRLNRVERVALWGLMALAASFHSTTVVLIAVITALGFVAVWRLEASAKRAFVTAGLIALTVVPAMAGGRVYKTLSEKMTGVPIYSPPFVTARVIDDGTGQRFLEEKCPTGRYDFTVCRFAGRTFQDHNHFLWGLKNDPSAYQASDLETQRALGDEQFRFAIAVTKAYPIEQATASATNALRELTLLGMKAELITVAHLAKSWPDSVILEATPQYAQCATNPDACDGPPFMTAWEGLVVTGFLLSLLALAMAAFRALKARDEDELRLIAAAAIVLFAMIGNGVICSIVSGVHPRYQSRLEWVLPALALAGGPQILSLLRRRS